MQVLSDGVPMTCGEVYALLRRRRDERSAMRQPPFALQLAQADPHNRLASHANSSNTSNALTAAAAAAAAANSGVQTANSTAAALTTAMTTMPMNVTSHVVVLLSEVQLLSYLYHHARLSTDVAQTVPALYGPSSVYVPVGEDGSSAAQHEGDKKKKGNDREDENNNNNDEAGHAWLAKVGEGQRRVAATQPGTREHVQAVQALLAQYEAHGRAAEAQAAAAVRELLQAMHTQGYWPCQPEPPVPAADVVRVKQEVRDDDDEEHEALRHATGNNCSGNAIEASAVGQAGHAMPQHEGANGAGRRQATAGVPLLSAPSSLLCDDDFAMQPPSSSSSLLHSTAVASSAAAPAVSNTASAQANTGGQHGSLLSEEELMRVVMARPCSSLDVHRLLDGLDERLAGREEAIAFLVDGLTRIFSR